MSTSQKLFALFVLSFAMSILLASRGWKLYRDYNYRCDSWFTWAVTCFVFSIFVLVLCDQAARGSE